MNRLIKAWKYLWNCKLKGDHTTHLTDEQIDRLSYVDIHTICLVCGIPIIAKNNEFDNDTYWEIED